MGRISPEQAVKEMKSSLTAIERFCLEIKGMVKRGVEISPSELDTLIDILLKMCQQQRELLLILKASKKRGREG